MVIIFQSLQYLTVMCFGKVFNMKTKDLLNFYYEPSYKFLDEQASDFITFLESDTFDIVKQELIKQKKQLYFSKWLEQLNYSVQMELDNSIVPYLQEKGLDGFLFILNKLMMDNLTQYRTIMYLSQYLVLANVRISLEDFNKYPYVFNSVIPIEYMLSQSEHFKPDETLWKEDLHVRLDLAVQKPELVDYFIGTNVFETEHPSYYLYKTIYFIVYVNDTFDYDFTELNKRIKKLECVSGLTYNFMIRKNNREYGLIQTVKDFKFIGEIPLDNLKSFVKIVKEK